MKFAALARSAALVTAVALIPATTASIAQVDGRAGPEFAKVLAVYQRIKASYVDPVDDDVLIRGMIDGMLAALDPHSGFLDGSDLQRLETMIDGNYSGLGLSVVAEDGAVKVISPFRGSPADNAGDQGGRLHHPSRWAADRGAGARRIGRADARPRGYVDPADDLPSGARRTLRSFCDPRRDRTRTGHLGTA